MHACMYMYVCIIYTCRERERDRERETHTYSHHERHPGELGAAGRQVGRAEGVHAELPQQAVPVVLYDN